MRGIKFVLIVALAIGGLALGTGVGASSGKPAAAHKSPQIREVIIKGGVRSLGPIPARVQRLLKKVAIAPAFSCSGAKPESKVNNATAQTCIWPDNYTGLVVCIQTSTSPTVTQTCDTTQTGTTQNNQALIIQIVWSMNPRSPQDNKQIVLLRQMNGSGANLAGISQYIKQSQGPGTPDDTDESATESPLASPTSSAVQTQNSHQTVHLRQLTTAAGDNNAVVLQFLRQRERGSNVGTVNQKQNLQSNPVTGAIVCARDSGSDNLPNTVIMDPNANQCVLSNQTSTSTTGGHLNLGVNQDYNQFQRVRKAGGGSQYQGVDNSGGGDIGLVQLSPVQSNILTNQNEDLVQRAIDSTSVFQDQNGPRKGAGSTQGMDGGDVWRGFQTSNLIQTSTTTGLSLERAAASVGHQSDLLDYFGVTSGDIRATQTSNLNGAVTNWGCPAPGTTSTGPNQVCAAHVKCEAGGGDLRSRSLQAVASACFDVTGCPDGTVFNSGTGICEVFDTSTFTGPSYARRR
jgi:hypothetical protein